ncbi:hypothetical protein jhhlp_003440 [Lomentospora prolificans]|uniref:Zn(2)-C6 fungal-type domain-containing protein n=1 Tax=Lomentospora prolificans TaxID=41688 RepID=A0A2N3N8R4_9PEZI|nr:hypothetical protein jhhlp_003440 [Lomentospora prolificans]
MSVALTTPRRGLRGRLKESGRAQFFEDPPQVGHGEQSYPWDWFADDIQQQQQQQQWEDQQQLSQLQDPRQWQPQDRAHEPLFLLFQNWDPSSQAMIPVPPRQGQFPDTPGSTSSEGTSQRSAAASSTPGLQNQQPKKRTRASKPKVRTGCITWIRRVKCGEEKPACIRCTSTGRVCDGYDTEGVVAKKQQQQQQPSPNQLLAQNRSRGLQPAPTVANPAVVGLSPSSSVTTPVASSGGTAGVVVPAAAASTASAASVSSSSSSPPSITVFHASPANAPVVPGLQPQIPFRPSLRPEIDLTDVETAYLSEFTRVAEVGLSQHVSNLDEFWRWTVPRMCMQDRTVRHAIVALGAALRTYRQAGDMPGHTAPGSGIGAGGGGATIAMAASQQSEVVMLEHYGQAMALLRQANLAAPGAVTLALVCCLAFVYIESLRGNWPDALTHLRSGLTIIDTIPLDTLKALADPQGCAMLPSGPLLNLGNEMDYVLRAFATLESSACLYTDDFEPTIALKLYRSRNLSESIQFPEFADINEAHRAVAQFSRDVLALSWTWQKDRSRTANRVLPSVGGTEMSQAPQAHVVAQRDVLRLHASRLEARLRQFREGPSAPQKRSIEYTSMLMDVLHFTCCKELCSSLDRDAPLAPTSPTFEYVDPLSEATYANIVQIAESIKHGISSAASPAQRGRWFMIDIGIVCPLHFVVYNCRDESTREKALDVLQDWSRRENLWDGPEIVRLLRAAGPRVATAGAPEVLPLSLSRAVAIPALRERLDNLSIKEDDDDHEQDDEMLLRKRGRPFP